jgi:photosystem II stability/assembly factor-like uncharacterized protein
MKIRSCVFQVAFSVLALFAACLTASAQWAIQNSNTTADLRGIHAVDGNVAWASGTNGTVMETIDGGATWRACAIPPDAEKLDFRGVQALDAKTAIVMSSGKGDLSRLYKTTDGCRTWKLIFTDPDPEGFFDCIRMSGKGGILLGDPVRNRFAVFETADDGATWIRDERRGLSIKGRPIAAFAASNSVVAHFPSGYMRGFVTGGAGGAFLVERWSSNNWSMNEIPVGSSSESSGVFSLGMRFTKPRCTDCDHPSDYFFIAVGGDYAKPIENSRTAAWSTDLGKSWTVSSTLPRGYRSAVAYDAGGKMWITVGPNGTDVSTDDGKNWRALRPDVGRGEAADADRNWNALSLPFVVGPKGRIGKLTQGSGGREAVNGRR